MDKQFIINQMRSSVLMLIKKAERTIGLITKLRIQMLSTDMVAIEEIKTF
jgi:hypothetical protein